MRYQALILLVIVLLSSYLLRETSVFSQSGFGSVMKATVVETIDLNSKQDNQEIVASSSGQSLENPKEETIQPQPEAKIQSETMVVEKPVIVDSLIPSNELCVQVGSKIYLAQTIDGATVLYDQKSQDRWPIASITKLMSAIIALENLNQSSVIEITDQIRNQADGYTTFASSSSYNVNDLIKAMLSVSSNDAAYALSESIGTESFVKKMNDKAKEISMSQTTFFEPSGLSYLNQSTAKDLYILISYINRHYKKEILDITRQKIVSVKNQTTKKIEKLSNINLFAGRKDFFGGKTGYIDQSGGNLVSLFIKNGKMIFIGVLGSEDRFAETEKILSCVK